MAKRDETNHNPSELNLRLGAPQLPPRPTAYTTRSGIAVAADLQPLPDARTQLDHLVTQLDHKRGAVFESSYEFPGRYARWTMGFQNPPLAITANRRTFKVDALNTRGHVLLAAVHAALRECPAVATLESTSEDSLCGTVRPIEGAFAEEDRSRQNSIFSVVRAVCDLFYNRDEPMLGLYGAFGYDLTFQFEPVRMTQQRDDNQRDMVLYLPDELLVIDVHTRKGWRVSYDFTYRDKTTQGLPREGASVPYVPLAEADLPFRRDHAVGEFAGKVERAKREFECGNLFEVVLSQTFGEVCPDPPSTVFFRLRERNPSPYGFIINLGASEYLVGASPEMFVRVERGDNGDWRCETCPISGTIRRGRDALEDAENIRTILSDKKEESELTMCTDVDRNDKSRICRAGSVRVIGRRQIEMYSRLIHTVDHVEGYLREGFDAMDAFLAHTWAVTVTGAPKPWAIQFVEEHEESARHWYGGAVGVVGFDGCLNTGLTLRTVRIVGGMAQIRAGATLLYDSQAAAEEKETELKASAMRDAVLRRDAPAGPPHHLGTASARAPSPTLKSAARVLLIDHQDSFVHTLANYLRQTGALVTTLRSGFDVTELERLQPTLVVLSPGPGNPRDFGVSTYIDALLARRLPIFGVCLGLQAIVEHYGGELDVLGYPQHGKPGEVQLSVEPGDIFHGLPPKFSVGRYHSLHSKRERHPSALRVTAETNDGVIMGIQHESLPIAAVQFHPESILTRHDLGVQMLVNAMERLRYKESA